MWAAAYSVFLNSFNGGLPQARQPSAAGIIQVESRKRFWIIDDILVEPPHKALMTWRPRSIRHLSHRLRCRDIISNHPSRDVLFVPRIPVISGLSATFHPQKLGNLQDEGI